MIAIAFAILAGLSVALESIPTYGGSCYKISCDELPTKCSEKSNLETTITLSNQCKTSEYCNVNAAFSGYCDAKNYYVTATPLYPGTDCDTTSFR